MDIYQRKLTRSSEGIRFTNDCLIAWLCFITNAFDNLKARKSTMDLALMAALLLVALFACLLSHHGRERETDAQQKKVEL